MLNARSLKIRFARLAACALVAAAAASSTGVPAAAGAQERPPRIRAPELDGAEAWVNAPKPLRLSELEGKVVLLDFWTYG